MGFRDHDVEDRSPQEMAEELVQAIDNLSVFGTNVEGADIAAARDAWDTLHMIIGDDRPAMLALLNAVEDRLNEDASSYLDFFE